MTETNTVHYGVAVEDFRHARRQAALEAIAARLTGRSSELLSYEEVRRKLRARESGGRKLTEIPLDAIIGSAGRYGDFTRSFLPRRDSDQERWARVAAAASGLSGLPPIEVYQIGDAYFVHDGNHRVSVARQMGATHIQAYVTKAHTPVPLSPDTDPDDLILMAEYAEFLAQTHLNTLRPDADLRVTEPGQYPILLEHIEVHRYFMGIDFQREIAYEEAVTHWYDTVYRPVVEVIREKGILRDFPQRTEADLYLWLARHRADLEEQLGWEIATESAAVDLLEQRSTTPWQFFARVGERLLDAVVPDELEDGPPAGQWRRERLAGRRDDYLFADILVAINGHESGWCAMEQALAVARQEEARLHGLYIVHSDKLKAGPKAQAVQEEFDRRCAEAQVGGKLAMETGAIARRICERARWADLVVVSLEHPPRAQPIARLSSGFRTLVRRCARPVLAVPGQPTQLHNALLAYDGSPKAQEALFVAAYLASRWQIALSVVSVAEEGRTRSEALTQAQEYLENHRVAATFVLKHGEVPEAILDVAEEQKSDLIIMGGYGFNPMLEVVLGSAVDQVLREAWQPILICR